MVTGYDAADWRARREDGDSEPSRPKPELRWVELRGPRRAVEVGANGRIVASHYHEGYDSWQVLLETYEGELTE